MLGIVRFLLAIMVMLNHIWLPTANKIGAHAVIAFYMVSGYLMAKVTLEVYGIGPANSVRFLANRFLRIFPSYWLYVVLTMLGLLIFPTYFGRVYSTIQWPDTFYKYFSNITLIDMTTTDKVFVPPAWSLCIEFLFYIAFAFGISTNRKVTLLWLAGSLIVAAYLLWSGAPFGQRYTPFYSASLYFAIGAAIHHFPDLRRIVMPLGIWGAMLAIFSVWPLVIMGLDLDRSVAGYYPAALLFVPILTTALATRSSSLDRILGDMAYPIFLSHLFGYGIVNLLTLNRADGLSATHATLTIVATLLISGAHIKYFDPRINALRDRIRTSSTNRKISA